MWVFWQGSCPMTQFRLQSRALCSFHPEALYLPWLLWVFASGCKRGKNTRFPHEPDPRHFCSPLVCSYSVTWPLLTTQKTGQCSLVLCPGEKGEGVVNSWPASGMWPLLQETRGFVFYYLVLVMTDLQGRDSWWVFIKLCMFSRRNNYTEILFFKGLKC